MRTDKRKTAVSGPTRREALSTAGAAVAGAAGAGAASAQEADPRAPMEGKSVFITGSARGIGRAAAIAFAKQGADVLAFDICAPVEHVHYPPATPEDLEETKRRVEALGRRCVTVIGDQRDEAAVRSAFQRAVGTFGKVDVMIPNAGVAILGSIAETSADAFDTQVRVNLHGTANCLRVAIPHMTSRGEGRIIATASILGRQGMAGVSHYAASKWAIIGLVKSAALEVAESGVTVNCVSPGPLETTLLVNEATIRERTPEGSEPTRETYAAALDAQSPLPTPWNQPEEVAAAMVYLASDATRHVTGTEVMVSVGGAARLGA